MGSSFLRLRIGEEGSARAFLGKERVRCGARTNQHPAGPIQSQPHRLEANANGTKTLSPLQLQSQTAEEYTIVMLQPRCSGPAVTAVPAAFLSQPV
jgi:hypothetical protein